MKEGGKEVATYKIHREKKEKKKRKGIQIKGQKGEGGGTTSQDNFKN